MNDFEKQEKLDQLRKAQKLIQECEIALLVVALGIIASAFILLHYNITLSPKIYVYICLGMLIVRNALRFYRWSLRDKEQDIENGVYDNEQRSE